MSGSVITGTGACIPENIQLNKNFEQRIFFDEKGVLITDSPELIIEKFRRITGILERRYVPADKNTSDIAAEAGRMALEDSGIDPETLDQIVVAHNFGDVAYGSLQSQNVPTLASRVKHLLGIVNPGCIAYDVLVGCPGWIHALIQSHAWFKAGMAKKILLIGAETLSRVIDPADRDSLIFSDGAGACVVEYQDHTASGRGILGCCAQTHTAEVFDYIDMGKSYNEGAGDPSLYIKMKGRKVYEYALKNVPLAMKCCLDRAAIDIRQVNKILIHQANEKMDAEIVKRLFSLYSLEHSPDGIMPMSIQWLGNSSVATVPTLFHLIRKGAMPEHELVENDIVLFASVGAGMNINAVCYRV